ncbi:MAG: NAD(P)/FAD-dependent oxidoreductase [Chloroflexi bacterium]|nr:NAD(P)/FAD-dependent oxidoreductase [Chloroflexota bacterium]
MTDKADITIIGAGVVGLGVASEVARPGREVYVLEKNESFGREQSTRNSEVIHAGIYYDRDSLRARLCVEGNNLLYELCERTGIGYKKCGKIIVAVSDIEAEELAKLYQRGCDNGAPLKMLSRQEMSELEPNMTGLAAFLSPTTGIIDAYGLVRYFEAQARGKGVQIAYKAEVTGIDKASDGYRIATGSGDSFISRVVINCAGLYSDHVAALAGINIEQAGYKLHWCKGEYYNVGGGKNRLISRLIYPVPMAISVGVHVCFDVSWRLRLGPLFYYVDKLDYGMNDANKGLFLTSSMMKALPFLAPEDLEPESAGIMAMLQGPGEGFRDFVIRHEADRGLPGLINLIGIESPGLTASPAIARYVSQMVDEVV